MKLSEAMADVDKVIAEAEQKSTRLARAYFKACPVIWGGHEYLTSHGVTTPLTDSGTLRTDPEAGLLLAPMLRDGHMVSVQMIDVAGKREEWPIVPTSGTYFMSHMAAQSMTVLASSLAVGLLCVGALRGSAKTARCLVAWGGLDDVIPPDLTGFLVIAASKDEGPQADQLAAMTGAGIAIPSGCIGSTWCDWRREQVAAKSANAGRKTPVMLERDTDAALSLMLSKFAKYIPPKVGLASIPKVRRMESPQRTA